jgi:Ca2+-binding RTX toxin-like protein
MQGQITSLNFYMPSETSSSAEFLISNINFFLIGAMLEDGRLRIDGTNGDDDILIQLAAGDSNVIDVLFGGVSVGTFPLSVVTGRLIAHGYEGNDTIRMSPNVPRIAEFYGDGGDDTLLGGLGNDLLAGGDGNDQLTGWLGADTINGGSGIDRLVETMNVGMKLTNVSLTGIGARVDTLLGINQAVLTGGGSPNFLDASAFTNGQVTLAGGDGNDVLIGGALSDSLIAGKGDDRLTGGTGNDTLDGGAGYDRVMETGNVNFKLTNTSLTGLGTDVIRFINGAVLTGGAGNNRLDAGAFTNGQVTLIGFAGHDTLIGGMLSDSLSGGEGNDSLVGSAGNDTLSGGAGNDTGTGGPGADFFSTVEQQTS